MRSAAPPVFDLLMVRNRLFSFAKRSNVCSTILKGLRFADSHESRFQASKRSSIGSVILVGGRTAEI